MLSAFRAASRPLRQAMQQARAAYTSAADTACDCRTPAADTDASAAPAAAQHSDHAAAASASASSHGPCAVCARSSSLLLARPASSSSSCSSSLLRSGALPLLLHARSLHTHSTRFPAAAAAAAATARLALPTHANKSAHSIVAHARMFASAAAAGADAKPSAAASEGAAASSAGASSAEAGADASAAAAGGAGGVGGGAGGTGGTDAGAGDKSESESGGAKKEGEGEAKPEADKEGKEKKEEKEQGPESRAAKLLRYWNTFKVVFMECITDKAIVAIVAATAAFLYMYPVSTPLHDTRRDEAELREWNVRQAPEFVDRSSALCCCVCVRAHMCARVTLCVCVCQNYFHDKKIEYLLFVHMRKYGLGDFVSAIPTDLGAPDGNRWRAARLARLAEVREYFVQNPQVLEDVWRTILASPKLMAPEAAYGLDAKALTTQEMFRISWVLELFTCLCEQSHDANGEWLLRIQRMHEQSVQNQKEFQDNFPAWERARLERETAAREKRIAVGLQSIEANFASKMYLPTWDHHVNAMQAQTKKEAMAQAKADFLASVPPVTPLRLTKEQAGGSPPPTFIDALMRHAMHRVPIESAADLQEIWQNNRLVELQKQHEEEDKAAHSFGLQTMPQSPEEAEAFALARLQADERALQQERPLSYFEQFVSRRIEANISLSSWVLLKNLLQSPDPTVATTEAIYGPEPGIETEEEARAINEQRMHQMLSGLLQEKVDRVKALEDKFNAMWAGMLKQAADKRAKKRRLGRRYEIGDGKIVEIVGDGDGEGDDEIVGDGDEPPRSWLSAHLPVPLQKGLKPAPEGWAETRAALKVARAELAQAHRDLDARLANMPTVRRRTVTARSLRRSFVREHLVRLAWFASSSSSAGGATPHWSEAALPAAMDVLSIVLFDIPDLTATKFRNEKDKEAVTNMLHGLANTSVASQFPAAAVQAFTHVLELVPNPTPAILIELAAEQVKLGQLLQVRQVTDQAIERRMAANEVAKATQAIDPSTNPMLPQSMALLRRAIKLEETNLEANFAYLKALLALGGADATPEALTPAVEGLIKAVRASPTSHEIPLPDGTQPFSEPLPTLSPAYNLLIRTLERLHRVDEALEMANEWSHRVTADAVAHFTLGRLQLKYEGPQEALEALETAFELDPQRPESAYQLALAFLRSKDPSSSEQARALAQKALRLQQSVQKRVQEAVSKQLDDQSAELKSSAGFSEEGLDINEAMYKHLNSMTANEDREADLAVAAAMQPNATAEDHAAAHAAQVAQQQAFERAHARFLQAQEHIVVHNPVAGAHLILAQLDQREGRPEEALQHVQEFIALRPTSTDGYMLKVKLLQQQKQMLASYATLATLLRVWQLRIKSASRAAAAQSVATKGAKKASKTPRADYFAAHPKEKQLLANIDAICAAPTSKHLQDKHNEFKNMCEQLNKLKKTN